MGSVFSPYYRLARHRGRPDPENHCALNVALYGVRGPSWSCTDRGRGALARDADRLAIGRSALTWTGSALEIRIDEVTAPLPTRLRGTVRVVPEAIGPDVFELDAAGRHRWWPIAPCCRVEVVMERPDLRWSGRGYLDMNEGEEPLEDTFAQWHWSRAALRDGTAVLYDVTRRDGRHASLALRFDPSGRVSEEEPPPHATLPKTLFGLSRATRAEAGSRPAVRQTLEDGPFYARSILSTRLFGEDSTAMHESLSLDRLRKPWVQLMLPFRMPRALG